MPPRAEQTLFDALRAYDLPVGVYVVRMVDGVETITQVNLEFVRIFEFDSFEEVEGKPVTDLYGSRDVYDEFRREFERAAEQNRPLHSHHEKLRNARGDLIPLEVHARADYDEAGDLIGRTGVVVPISDLEMLLGDIGQVLHRYSHTLVNLRLQLDSLQNALSDNDDPFGSMLNVPTFEDADAVLSMPAEHLARALERALEGVEPGSRVWACLPASHWQTLQERLMLLTHYREQFHELELYPAMLQMAARDVLDVFGEMKSGYMAKQTRKDVLAKARELERLICLFDIHQSTGQILEMEHEVLTARELALYSVRPRVTKETLPVHELITEAYRTLEDFAASRKIEVRIEATGRRRPMVRVIRRDAVRAVQNLLHNAIKYSWTKPTDTVWIDIRHGIDDETGMVAVSIENYGVGIFDDEIETGKIYELGYRGRLSGDRSRRGTGIGLYDALRVARAHGGTVFIESRPASGYDDEEEQQPYITSVTLMLPVQI